MVDAKTVQLAWDASPSMTVSGYEISVFLTELLDSTLLTVNVGNVLTQTIPNLEDTHDHWFCVKAYDGQGNKSVCSNIVHSPMVLLPLPEIDFKFNVELMK